MGNEEQTNMSYLTCPYCPSQAFPVDDNFHTWVGGYKIFQPTQKFRCASKHEFFIMTPLEEEINGRQEHSDNLVK